MALIRDRHGHILGEEAGEAFIVRHEGRRISVKGENVTVVIVCEQCGEPFTHQIVDKDRANILA